MSLLVLFGAFSAHGAFRIMTYNVLGLPDFLNIDVSRFRDIRERMSDQDLDVLCLQEGFTLKSRRSGKVRDLYYYAKGPNGLGKLANSGLVIRSRFPMDRVAHKAFSVCMGNDCLSKKGMLLVQTTVRGGAKVQVLNTHLNAEGGDSLRVQQMKEIHEFVADQADPSLPLVLVGDFNTSPSSEAYRVLVGDMHLLDLWNHFSPSSLGYTYDTEANQLARAYSKKTGSGDLQARLDYVFIPSQWASYLQPKKIDLVFSDPVPTTKGRLHWLSDHFGLVVDFTLSD